MVTVAAVQPQQDHRPQGLSRRRDHLPEFMGFENSGLTAHSFMFTKDCHLRFDELIPEVDGMRDQSTVEGIFEDGANPTDLIPQPHRPPAFRHDGPQTLEVRWSQIDDKILRSEVLHDQIGRPAVVPEGPGGHLSRIQFPAFGGMEPVTEVGHRQLIAGEASASR